MIHETPVNCPYCGERITVLLDGSVDVQSYVEDCQVCCRPMVLHVKVDPNGLCTVEARHENES